MVACGAPPATAATPAAQTREPPLRAARVGVMLTQLEDVHSQSIETSAPDSPAHSGCKVYENKSIWNFENLSVRRRNEEETAASPGGRKVLMCC